MLWPPDTSYADFAAADTGAAAVGTCEIASIQFANCSSSQPENLAGTGDGNSTRDCVYEPGVVHLRAERNGACSPFGRVYEIQMVAVDVCGNTATSNPFNVGVWHDRWTAPTTGTVYHGDANGARPGANGSYGPGCGPGSPACGEVGPAYHSADADPEVEISQSGSISVDDLHLDKASGGDFHLTWSDPTLLSTIHVTGYHIYRLDPATLFWTQIAELTVQTLSYEDPILNDGSDWQYKVTAVIR